MISLFEAVKSGRVEGTDFRQNYPFLNLVECEPPINDKYQVHDITVYYYSTNVNV